MKCKNTPDKRNTSKGMTPNKSIRRPEKPVAKTVKKQGYTKGR